MYQPEVSTFLAQAISWAFFIILIGGGVAGWLNAKPLQTPDILKDLANDRIQLGYIDDNVNSQVNVALSEDGDEIAAMKKQIQLLKLKKELKSLQEESSVDNVFFEECVDAMIALGEKKTEAKKKTKQILAKDPKINTVDSFIQQAYKS